jgi:hypothetical protein
MNMTSRTRTRALFQFSNILGNCGMVRLQTKHISDVLATEPRLGMGANARNRHLIRSRTRDFYQLISNAVRRNHLFQQQWL